MKPNTSNTLVSEIQWDLKKIILLQQQFKVEAEFEKILLNYENYEFHSLLVLGFIYFDKVIMSLCFLVLHFQNPFYFQFYWIPDK